MGLTANDLLQPILLKRGARLPLEQKPFALPGVETVNVHVVAGRKLIVCVVEFKLELELVIVDDFFTDPACIAQASSAPRPVRHTIGQPSSPKGFAGFATQLALVVHSKWPRLPACGRGS
jgi:hypothetical protein